jgi:hypothetical protein
MGSGDRSTDLQLPETADFSYQRLAEAGLADFVAFFYSGHQKNSPGGENSREGKFRDQGYRRAPYQWELRSASRLWRARSPVTMV